ncbi:photosystem II repair protein Psb32 [Acaryochloris sp. CCMEE 5410]|uniref:photosystem II repair protein Psb32 n=1 Tax=Acaryochloris sp. CCMEE 5410 TaxID=310037 RepID=UPI0002485128|nr:TPM domain-containing protein [Acaryochloris sp. CCMEE 5410]KAI9130506.1 TPM domain-containing protein [Acaryochloris sp. CCMEE 5410]
MKVQLNKLWDWKGQLQRWLIVGLLTLLVGLPLWSPPALATVVEDIPNLSASQSTWLADKAELLSVITERSVNKTLKQISRQTGTDVRVITIRGLNYGETADSFANTLFEQWFPTSEDQANQVLLVYDARTNAPAILVGQEAQKLLSEETAQSIAFDNLLIPIRKGNYNEAFIGAGDRFAAVITGQEDPGPPEVEVTAFAESNFRTAEETNDTSSAILVVVLLILATAIPMLTYFYYQRS